MAAQFTGAAAGEDSDSLVIRPTLVDFSRKCWSTKDEHAPCSMSAIVFVGALRGSYLNYLSDQGNPLLKELYSWATAYYPNSLATYSQFCP